MEKPVVQRGNHVPSIGNDKRVAHRTGAAAVKRESVTRGNALDRLLLTRDQEDSALTIVRRHGRGLAALSAFGEDLRWRQVKPA